MNFNLKQGNENSKIEECQLIGLILRVVSYHLKSLIQKPIGNLLYINYIPQ